MDCMKSTILKRVGVVLLAFLCFIGNLTPIWGLTASEIAEYKGTYDYKAPHDILNPMSSNFSTIATEEYREGILKTCYQVFIGWGMTPEGAAGVCANISMESGGIPNICWGMGNTKTASYTWDDYVKGYDGDVGFGLFEFTAKGVVFEVWDTAASLGVQWTDLGAQLSYVKKKFGPDGKPSIEEMWGIDDTWADKFYKSGYTATKQAEFFCRGFERPADLETACAKRGTKAEELLTKWKNLPPIDLDSIIGNPNGGNTVDLNAVGGLVDEWDLTGMPKKSGLIENAVIPTLPDYSNLTAKEQYSIGAIRNNLEAASAFDAWNIARQVLVFIGLVLVTYTILLVLAMIFDTVNVFFDFSLVRVLSFGRLNYCPDLSSMDATMVKQGKLIGKKKLIITLIVFFAIACLFIAGGVLPVVLKAVYWVMGKFNGTGV